MDFLFHPRVGQESREIERGYREVSTQLADRFWTKLNEGIDDVFENPERHHFDASGCRRRNLKKVPFHILFEIRPEVVRIMVVRHDSRNSGYGMRRR